MKKKNFIVLSILVYIFIFFNFSLIFAQSGKKWFPSELNIQPFTANFLEPRVGFLFNVKENNIRLDIGNSIDLIQYESTDEVISFGADFFTYTRIRGEKEFHFPVETIDYLFGINSGYKKTIEDNEIGLRFRLSHISAHLVDGQFDKSTFQWRNGRLPEVYSREFIEIFPFIRFYNWRFYLGFTHIFHSSPKNVKKNILQLGFDYFLSNNTDNIINPFFAYDFKLSGKNKYIGNNFINFGIKFGKFNKKGLSIYYSFISGHSIHGEYFDIIEKYSNVGFNIDL
ncbi:MAG: DUF1207 domain-containing protein [Ignavibacterium sp.]|nr:DUF1207 domain-containing protein [Ignavibacterium sp.]